MNDVDENKAVLPSAQGPTPPVAGDATISASLPEQGKPQVPPPSPIAAKPAPAIADKESLVETVKTVVYALLIALVIRTFFFQPFNIPSGSMEATLLVGDYLFVEKFAYGYSRYSFPWGIGPLSSHSRVWMGKGPKRGDVIVFKLPVDNSTDYIKRVIGLPGDRIQLINGQVYLNDKPVPRVPVAPLMVKDVYDICGPNFDPTRPPTDGIPRFRETLPGGKSYNVLACNQSGPDNNTDVYVVPAGHYFMMGDNRDNSLDSRFSPDGSGFFQQSGGVGFVPAANLVGKAVFLFFSNDGPIWEIWNWPWSVRVSRMFKTID